MDDRTITPAPMEHPGPAAARGRDGAPAPFPVDDPRALTILTTEHWSLLSARSLVYNEAFARAGMFLSFLAATLVALGLMSTAMGFSNQFLGIVALVLGLDLFIGLATMGRVATTTSEDIRFLQGMNRLRHAYHETVPGLEPYFITGHYDDVLGIFANYGADVQSRTLRSVVHGFTTVVGMLGVINAALTGVVVGTLAILVLGSDAEAIAIGVVAFILVLTDERVLEHARHRGDGGGPPSPVPQPGRLTGRRSAANRSAPGDAGGAGVALRRGGATWRGAAASPPCGDRLTRPWRSISMTTTMTSSPTDTTSSTLGTW